MAVVSQSARQIRSDLLDQHPELFHIVQAYSVEDVFPQSEHFGDVPVQTIRAQDDALFELFRRSEVVASVVDTDSPPVFDSIFCESCL